MLPTLVITSAVAWDGITARPQHLARQLAQLGWPVVFVEPPVTLIGPLRNPTLRSRMFPQRPIEEIQDLDGGPIRILRPVTTLPFYHVRRPINRFNQKMLARQIREHVPGPKILLSNLPSSVDLLPWITPMATFYDCVDDHAAFGGLTSLPVMERLEVEMACASRSVFATADALAAKMQQYHSDVRLVPNAVELAHFRKTHEAHVHVDLADIPTPRVGFVGGIGAWLDFSLIRALAVGREDVQFVFIGPIEADVSQVRQLPNVHFLGRKPYAELPEYLSGFDACLYPFANNKLTESVNPVKVYEYLAAGKEVLATPTREMAKFADFVWPVPNADAGIAALDAILAGEQRCSAEQRDDFLENQTWHARAAIIDDAMRCHVPESHSL